ncbi:MULTISPECIES: oxygenase MpaB family protein [unclassified Cryobacterium]|uniref:oxygenase MpaB family protein n=1 Tax=unclassified Cryobacterium TaxID=2649013 RepID=UPI002AB331CC|nr:MULTISPECIES: oxygenase MpaB family protein [unclassified Cryobacterium]MDY7528595.1 oxygenase MpaB family protein [Cryobacterium sp. 10C2]MDY7555667.1 oxygenase MpaB family protein [Cryobacterium sp. 10C3]MEB0201490.1 oxygenase MpaB family protein [Cryobacterium sp. 5I3]MEB0290345.1 oxygenase MpaB family protein [Cryobacterium sp. 10C2]
MGRFTDSWRSHLLSTLSGNSEGRPSWVEKMELGEDAGFFGPGSAAWAVHGGMATMVAGIRALLMQTLHPGAMAGVHDWSRYREDPLGRLSGTIQWLVTVTFADTTVATDESTRVGRFHDRVTGTYLDAAGVSRPYAAGDAELLSWVHIVFTDAFLESHKLWGGSIPGGADGYVREWAKAGELVGVQNPPRSAAELAAQLAAFTDAGVLKSDERVAEAVRFIRNPPLRRGMLPFYRVMFAGAVASLPREYRQLLGLRRSVFPVVWATGAVLGIVRMLLGASSTSEDAARTRIDRIARARVAPEPDAEVSQIDVPGPS